MNNCKAALKEGELAYCLLSIAYWLSSARKLPQEPHVIFAEQANVVDAVLEQGGPFDTHPKRKTGVFFGVDITVFKHFRVNHTATQYFEPAGTFTNGATLAMA